MPFKLSHPAMAVTKKEISYLNSYFRGILMRNTEKQGKISQFGNNCEQKWNKDI